MKVRKSNREEGGERDAFVPRSVYKNWEPGPLPPIATDGGFDPKFAAVNVPDALPAATPENMICLRGPCRNYWTLVTNFGAGNPKGTFQELNLPVPRQHHHICTLIDGMETDLTEDVCYDCNRWDPLIAADLEDLEKRRATYLQNQPEEENEPARSPEPEGGL